jgi:L-ascorbate metabolism protein UlaG (beta-lactamase superfamily)
MLSRLLLALCVAGLAACAGPRYQGPPSDHFDGQRFHNAEPFDKGWRDLLRYYRTREPGVWVRDMGIAPGPPPQQRVGPGELRVTVVNHATVLIQADGLNVLTDPIWSERASPVSWAGPRRFVPPGLRFEDLPPIDLVLISHNHFDHMDLPTLRRLEAAHRPLFVAGLGERGFLQARGLTRVTELDWWQALPLPNGCQLWGVPTRHWTGRGFGARNRSLWLGFVLGTRGGPVYFAGDTGYADHFRQTAARFGPMRLALLPIGAYEPRWLTAYQHMDPAEAVRAHQDLQARQSLAVHFGTFELSDEDQQQPPADLARARDAAGLPPHAFTAPAFGAGHDLPVLSTATTGCPA